jgi:hypothetical protein
MFFIAKDTALSFNEKDIHCTVIMNSVTCVSVPSWLWKQMKFLLLSRM